MEWRREFDVADSSDTLIFIANQKFKVLMQWGTFAKGDTPDGGPGKVQGDIKLDE